MASETQPFWRVMANGGKVTTVCETELFYWPQSPDWSNAFCSIGAAIWHQDRFIERFGCNTEGVALAALRKFVAAN